MQTGTNPNTKEERTNRNAFHYFAINNYVPLARLLEKWGTDVNHIDNYHLTSAKLAKQHNNMEAFDFLEHLEFKTKPEQINSKQRASVKFSE